MTWVKISDTALDEPFLLDLPRGAVLLHIEALAYSNRYAVDGAIHRAALRKLTTEPDPDVAAAALVSAGLWGATREGWQIRWLLNDQPSSAEIQAGRELARMRQERRRRHNKGDHAICDPDRCRVLTRDGKRDSTRDGRPPPTRPDPPRPEGERGGEDGNAAGLVKPAAAVMEEPTTVSCDDYTGHRSSHHLFSNGWVCTVCKDRRERRAMAGAIRDAPTTALKARHQRSFDRRWGDLYQRGVAA
jgi:hypothetical protein